MDSNALNIMGTALKLFMRFGIKSVSMDDIAREMGMSKKTLYKYFSSKKDLILQVTTMHNEEEQRAMEEISTTSKDAIDEMVLITNYVRGMVRELQPTIIFDLKKYHKESWKKIEAIHTECVYENILQNLKNGQKQGLYRKDVDCDMVARFYTGSTMMLMEEKLFPHTKFKKEELYNHYIDYHLHAVMTEEGKALYQKYSQL